MNHYNIDRLRESMVKILGSHGQPVAGSGFIIRSDGYLVTCHHVIYLLDGLNVEYQGQIYQAEWCEELSNSEVDIAILKIDVENAKAVPIINPQHLSTSVTVYGFPPSQKKYFPEGIAVSAQSIRRSAPLNAVSTYRTREIKATNPWNKLPQDESTFLSHRIDAKVDSGTSGGAVFAEELGGVVGVIQCSKSDESYVIRWDNITEYLDKLGLEPEKNAVCRFLKEIENNFKYDKLLHIPEQPIILKDQYISIQVTLERKYTHAIETTWGYAESEAELKRAYALKRLEESQPTQVDWQEAKKQHQRIMVLADPGMGKSTLLRREACLTAQEKRQSLKNHNKKLEEVVFPLFLRLSDLAETPEEIIDAIPVLIQRDYSETATAVMELLREKLKVGKCLLLLDALDEVPTEHRKRLVEKLNRFAQRKPPCPIICTSRLVGYSGAFVQGVKEVEIVPFSQKQIEQYIETWFRNAAGYLNDDTVSASSLIRELRNKPQIRGLAQNPLLLSLKALIKALKHEAWNVRGQVVEALGKTGNPQVVEALIKTLNDEDDYVREQAVRALSKIDNLQAIEALIQALKHEGWGVRVLAAMALGKINSPQVIEALITALNDENSYVKITVANALAEIRNPQAAEASNEIGNLQATEVFIEALNHEDWGWRDWAVRALVKIADPQVVEALLKALNDKNAYVRGQAAEALAKIGTPAILEKLIQLPEIDIRDPDIFPLARTLAVRFSKEKLPFIPVYPELVAH